MSESMNYGYKTTPQQSCDGRELDFSRGRGLGGSSACNFGVYTVGAQDDYEKWASLVDDENFSWQQMQRRFKDLETFDGAINLPAHQKYAQPKAQNHGTKGGLRIGYAKEWDADIPLVLDQLEAAGMPRNLDHNSGNPLGLSLMINSSSNGRRCTAADLLIGASDNLVVITDSPVQRLVLQGKKAVGIETNGKKYFATKEVVLAAGSLDTPRILMHSGIGRAEELQKFNIPLVQDLPAVGQGLRDHFFAPLIVSRNPATNDRDSFFGSEKAMEDALKQWEKDGTGPWARYACQVACGWFKSEAVLSSPEFKALPSAVQEFHRKKTVPQYELISGFPAHYFFPDLFKDFSYMAILVFVMNQETKGEVRLNSSDPDVPLLFDPKALSHPFDRRVCIESYREVLNATRNPAFAKDTTGTLLAPKSDSDEDIFQHWKETTSSTWHMTGTVKMGRKGEVDAAVDKHFRVFEIDNLRVADMSVVPVITNNHTQATAYVTGATCADVLIREYGLETPLSKL